MNEFFLMLVSVLIGGVVFAGIVHVIHEVASDIFKN